MNDIPNGEEFRCLGLVLKLEIRNRIELWSKGVEEITESLVVDEEKQGLMLKRCYIKKNSFFLINVGTELKMICTNFKYTVQ